MNNGHHQQVLHSTRIDILPEIRLYVIQLLNQTLACTVDLRSHAKQAGWNVKGRDFSPLQTLFATMASELEAYADLVAERIALLGGVALGTARTAAMQSRLPEYPGAIVDGNAHMVALAERFASYATAMRGTLCALRMSRMRTVRRSIPRSRAGSISGFGFWKRTSTADGEDRWASR